MWILDRLEIALQRADLMFGSIAEDGSLGYWASKLETDHILSVSLMSLRSETEGRSYVNLNGSTQLNSCDSDLLTQPNYPDSDRHVAQKFRVHATCKLPRLSNLRSNSIR